MRRFLEKYILFGFVIGFWQATEAEVFVPFPPQANQIEFSLPTLSFELLKDSQLKLGNDTVISGDEFKLSTRSDRDQYVFTLTLPKPFLSEGTLRLMRDPGAEIAQSQVKNSDLSIAVAASQIGPEGAVRLCLEQTSGADTLVLCSNAVQLDSGAQQFKPLAHPHPSQLRVASNEVKSTTGLVTWEKEGSIDFSAHFKSGASLALKISAPYVRIIDISKSETDGRLLVRGTGVGPTQGVEWETKERGSFGSNGIGYQAQKIWRSEIDASFPQIELRGSFGIPILVYIKARRLPAYSDRVFLINPPTGTYSSHVRLKGRHRTPRQLKSEGAIEISNSDEFHWIAAAPAPDTLNVARLEVPGLDGQNAFHAQYEIHRRRPLEFNLRSSYVPLAGESVLISEIAASAWLEDPFSAESSWYGRHHWGLNARAVQSLTNFPVEEKKSSRLSSTQFELRYNVKPGLWNQEELFGLLANYQNLDLSVFKGSLLGFGFYWARPMPKIFDDLLNHLPAMSYPKYVDLDLTVYTMSQGLITSPGANYTLNFHGKIFWSQRLFGEAGYGMKTLSVQKENSPRSTDIMLYYVMLGLGVLF